MYVRFGNMRMEEIEEALGIKFTEEHTSFFKETHVDKVSDMQSNIYKIPGNTWHAFELPMLQIHCGSKKMCTQVTEIIKSYMTDGGFPKEGAKIGLTHESLEEEKFGYAERKQIEDKGLEVYSVNYGSENPHKQVKFFMKVRETEAGNIFLQEIKHKENPDKFRMYVPNIDSKAVSQTYAKNPDGTFKEDENGRYIVLSEEDLKPIRRKKNPENIYYTEGKYVIGKGYEKTPMTIWDGKPIQL